MKIYESLELTVTMLEPSDIVRTSPDNIACPPKDWEE